MATNTWYIKNSSASGSSHGSLSDSTQGTSTTSTGWTVSTTAPTSYSLMQYGTKRAASTFGSTALPSSSPTTNDCWRTESQIKGVISAGTWTFATAIISSSAASSGSGKICFRLWKSSNPTGTSATEITSTTLTGNWSNVGTLISTNVTASTTFGEIILNNEYLFLQIALQIDTASSNSSADLLIRTDNTNSTIISPQLEYMHDLFYLDLNQQYGGDVSRDLESFDIQSYSTSETIIYTMRAKYLSSYKIWEVTGEPDTTGVNSGVNIGDLSDIVVINVRKILT